MSRKRRRKKFDYSSTIRFHDVHMDDVPKESDYKEGPGREQSFQVDVLAISVFFAVLAFLVYLGWTKEFAKAVAIGAGVGFIVAGWRTFFIYDRVPNVIEKTEYLTPVFVDDDEQQVAGPAEEVELTDPAWKLCEIPTADGRVAKFYQPRFGELANWLALVIRDADDDSLSFKNKVTLSKRTALRKRGWPEKLYATMIDQFYRMGWVYKGRNGVPEPTEEGLIAFIAWQKMNPPAPLIKRDDWIEHE